MIPEVTINDTGVYIGELNRNGSMCNAYSPFKNLQDANTRNLGDFTTPLLNFDLQHPVDIIPQDSYDGSVNLVLNDGKNQPRLIGSRFSVIDDGKFKITDHSGFKDTNIYDEQTFDIDTSLKTIALKIPKIKFGGFTQFAGSLLCGAYTFYFKLSDADGNESEVLAESGLIQLYIGGVSSNNDKISPDGIRMGTQDENTGKSISFELSNIDSGFDYVHVLYARSSSSEDQAAVDTYHKIVFDYPVVDGKALITITGNEQIIGISAEELYTDYADLDSVKTQAVVNNVLFFGNLNKQEHDWEALRRASWKIIPSIGQEKNVGSIDFNYNLTGQDNEHTGGYYNPYNVYSRVGYWPDEIYRFGIVYIFNDNSLSPVFNIPGVDFQKVKSLKITDLYNQVKEGSNSVYQEWESEPEDCYFNKDILLNSRGVIKLPRLSAFEIKGGIFSPKPLYINFDISNIWRTGVFNSNSKNELQSFLDTHKIKGLFFVRQKRIPTILAQGMTIGLTKKEFGAIPLIKYAGTFSAQSFLSSDQLIYSSGKYNKVPSSNVTINAMLSPDAEMCEATYNQIFVSNNHSLWTSGQYSFFSNKESHQYVYSGNFSTNEILINKRKLTNIQEDVKTLTDGDLYFSTLAGNPDEPYKTSDVKYEWDQTPAQTLTRSESVIRGKWGPYVGIGLKQSDSESDLTYGQLIDIKLENYSDDPVQATELDFQKRLTSAEEYHAICDRTEINEDTTSIRCYRGDCFPSLFTHRMFRNFIDPELPTNDKIINPACWAQNYAVHNTAIKEMTAEYNVLPENQGWYVTEDGPYANEIVQAFEVKENLLSDYNWDAEAQEWYIDGNPKTYVGKNIGGVSSVSSFVLGENISRNIKVVKPSEQEQGGAGAILKNIFKSSKWAIRGLSAINRADVNAVGLGQWITFPICSSRNLALRDIDYSNATEQASFNRKRSFYPLDKMDIHNPLRDSNVINQATAISLPHKRYYGMPNVPFIKQEFFTRVINSLRDSANSITNEFKVMLESAYRDYTKTYGSITKLMPLASKMLVVFQHGLGILALNDSMSNAENALQYLPVELSMVVSPTYGSMWKDSIIESQGYIYGLDSVAKVIWRVNTQGQLEIISQLKVEKFLIDNLDMSEFTTDPYIGHVNIKTHYNAFKHDIIFTYYNDILYRFDHPSYDDKPLSEWNIDSDGYLLNNDNSRTEYKGTKVTAQYNNLTGNVDKYTDIINSETEYLFKWAPGKSWSLCFNEALGKFTTFYDWIPLESENIDNIWFSFDREAANTLAEQGFNHSLPSAMEPTRGITLKDTNYSKNVIDNTFNSTCTINYIDSDSTAYFENIPIEMSKYTLCGFYLKGGVHYVIDTIGCRSSITVPDNEWTFVVARIKGTGNIKNGFQIEIENTTEGSRGAVTNLIYRIVDSEFLSKYFSQENQIIEINKQNLDDFYVVRDMQASLQLWKHGQAGIYDNEQELKPTHWYGQQHEFNFEFIARKDAVHKVFNNLQIISNKAEPNKFEFEVVGEVYDWHKYKPVLKWIADQVDVPTSYYNSDTDNYDTKLKEVYKTVLSTNYKQLCENSTFPKIFGMKDDDYFEKLPYLKVTDACVPTLDPQIIGNKKGTKDVPSIYLTPEQKKEDPSNAHSDNTVSCCIVYDKQLNEFRVHTEQLGNDVWKYGRLRGNMQYLEDIWRVEIRPVSFKYLYLPYILDSWGKRDYTNSKLQESRMMETRHRDKYIKIKVRYSGEDLAVIQGIRTLFDYSYA